MRYTSKFGPGEFTLELDPSEVLAFAQLATFAARAVRAAREVSAVAADEPSLEHEPANSNDDDGSVDPPPYRIVAGVPYLPLTEREQAARGEWAADSEDVGQHDTWKIAVQVAMWRHAHPDGRPIKKWSGHTVDTSPLFPLHVQVCEAMRRLHPWRLCAAAMSEASADDAFLRGRSRIDSFLTAHIEAAKQTSLDIFTRLAASEAAGGPANPFANVTDIEAQFVIFPAEAADAMEWTTWPTLVPLPEGAPTYE